MIAATAVGVRIFTDNAWPWVTVRTQSTPIGMCLLTAPNDKVPFSNEKNQYFSYIAVDKQANWWSDLRGLIATGFGSISWRLIHEIFSTVIPFLLIQEGQSLSVFEGGGGEGGGGGGECAQVLVNCLED